MDQRAVAATQPLIHINTAAEHVIATLPGVGPILAKKAVALRSMRGGFETIESFGEALDLKPHIVERLRPLVVIGRVDGANAALGGRTIDF
jgi:DNA uptake protein ComE-like DNA-binding protein